MMGAFAGEITSLFSVATGVSTIAIHVHSNIRELILQVYLLNKNKQLACSSPTNEGGATRGRLTRE